MSLAEEIGMSGQFALQLNLLLAESEQVQREKTHKRPEKQTHLAIFSKASSLRLRAKK